MTLRGRTSFDVLRRRLEHHLEREGDRSVPCRVVSAAWSRLASLERPLELPETVPVIGVAGATLGGSGVTPCVRALALHAAARGRRVTVLAHGYRGGRREPHTVFPDSNVADVGDEALELARAFHGFGPIVVGGRPRSEVLRRAARESDVIVVDGTLQASPRRLAISLLVLDGRQPWGVGICPPGGNLRAHPERLLTAADAVLVVQPPYQCAEFATSSGGRPWFSALQVLGPAEPLRPPAAAVSIEELRTLRIGVVAGIVRAGRMVEGLASLGVDVRAIVRAGDHASVESFRSLSREGSRGIDIWLTTAKCATKLGGRFGGAPLLVLRHHLELPPGLRRFLEERLAGYGDGCWSAAPRAMVPPCSSTLSSPAPPSSSRF